MPPMSCDVYKSKLFNVIAVYSSGKTEQRRNAIFKANPKGTSHFLLVFFALLVRQASLIFLVSLFVFFFTIFQSPSLSLLVVFLSLSLHPSSTLLVAISYSLKPAGLDSIETTKAGIDNADMVLIAISIKDLAAY
ncbi:hypothetical protein BKA70DRAFT_1316074 [Coprinopsis sp. MPI-PUGE-AT-0042]|nr:hypothetical protein BKA70DRAFT_1316074 [Coprinopsis sp. MPI-PUGE-AT-0042]